MRTPLLKLRKLDPDSWRMFARKAGAMKHRRDRRQAQRLRNELRDDGLDK